MIQRLKKKIQAINEITTKRIQTQIAGESSLYQSSLLNLWNMNTTTKGRHSQWCQGATTRREYERIIIKSLAEVPTVAGTLLDVDVDCSHRSTRSCSCNVGSTG